jgi:hypothetical protein
MSRRTSQSHVRCGCAPRRELLVLLQTEGVGPIRAISDAYPRRAIAAVTATVALSVPSTALAQIDSLSVSGGRLGPEGASVVARMTYQCQVGLFLFSGNVDIAQSTGFKLAQGSGNFFNPNVPCTGDPQTQDVAVEASGPFAFKPGKATATSFSLTVIDPATFSFSTESGGPVPIRITKK